MTRKLVVLALGLAAVVVVSATALAVVPGENPFPAAKVSDVFVRGSTVTATSNALGGGLLTGYFARGDTVVFRAFAGSTKDGSTITDKDAKYFYVQIPGQSPLKLAYDASNAQWPWTASWKVPADFPLGIVNFKILVQTKKKQYGSFQQMPVATAQLNITAAAPTA